MQFSSPPPTDANQPKRFSAGVTGDYQTGVVASYVGTRWSDQLSTSDYCIYNQGPLSSRHTGSFLYDTRSECRLRFSTPKSGAGFRLRLERVLFRGRYETVAIGLRLLFSFGLFVNSAESVNKHLDYIFFFFLLRFATIWMHNCSSNSIVVTFFRPCLFSESKIGADFWGRKSAPVFDHVCLQPYVRCEKRMQGLTPAMRSCYWRVVVSSCLQCSAQRANNNALQSPSVTSSFWA